MHHSVERFKTDLVASRNRHFSEIPSDLPALQRVRDYTADVDGFLIEIFTTFILRDNNNASVCLIALGGYGRAELCPYSDIDLLILHDNDRMAQKEIASAIRLFWDIGLTMGCVVRTIGECAGILGQDLASDMALLENRYLAGDAALRERLLATVITPYFAREKKRFVKMMRRHLHEQLYAPESGLYHVEPDLKNGTCTLRDCHRFMWAEKLRVGLSSMEQLQSRSKFTESQSRQFRDDYASILRLRCGLHMLCDRRMDVMETALQPQLGALFGFGEQGAGKLMEHFFKTVRSIKLFLLSYLEKNPGHSRIWMYARKYIGSVEAAKGIYMNDGIFFMTDATIQWCKDPVWIMTVFRQAVLCQASLSVELRNRIRGAVETLTVDDFRVQRVGELFREILAFNLPISHCLQLMHETETLWRLIPQFSDLTCKVEYDSYHEYTMDQHILTTLFNADQLNAEPQGLIRELYSKCAGKLILRLGLLLHDIGKALPGDHVVNGSIIAETVCERLGLTEDEERRVKLLIYHHLDMSEFSLHREPQPSTLRDFARILGDVENLDFLFLLTVLDIRSVGRHTWTSWKAYQLEQLYQTLKKLIESPDDPSLGRVPGHTVTPYDSYLREIIAEDRLKHETWLSSLTEGDIQFHSDQFHGFERITVCGWDRMGFLRDIIGCFSSEGYNILSARIFSLPGNKVLDIFYVEPPQLPVLEAEARIIGLQNKWNSITAGAATADDLVAQRLKRYPFKRLRPSVAAAATEIRVDNASSESVTLLEIQAADTFGLLHTIVQCLNKNGLNIRYAHLSTRVDRANDVFYVTNALNEKIRDDAAVTTVSREIVAAIQAREAAESLLG